MKTSPKPSLQHPLPTYVPPRYRNMRGKLKLSYDLHGVVDARPECFRALFRGYIKLGIEVHILTGSPWEKVRRVLREKRIPFTHFFSIVDHHKAVGTPMRWDDKGNAHMDAYLWDQTKAIYCVVHQIDMHHDDSDIYGRFFKTPYTRYYSKDTPNDRKRHLC